MQLSHSHSLGHRQSLVVSQQLRQAIVLLQMSNPELQTFIESQAEENPFVEFANRPAVLKPVPIPQGVAGGQREDWDRMGALADTRAVSLYTHVAGQIGALEMTEAEIELATVFVDALEPSGWLGATLDDLAQRGGVPLAEARQMLTRLQALEPTGIFARNLAECLRLQAAERGLLSPLFARVLDHLPMLAAADLNGLARICQCTIPDLHAILRDLRGLDPKPGARFDTTSDPVRAPDLIVSAAPEGGWQIELNRSTLPRVVIREHDARQLTPAEGAAAQARNEARSYVSERLSVARWLARAVEHRNRTVLRIGEEILRRQAGFLEQGPEHLHPMTLKEIAAAADVHESTVSRVTTGILMLTPHGVLPLKKFFTAALPTQHETGGSAGAVRHRIGRLIRSESAARPLSDDQLARLMADEGITVARRTVAKYREQLNIPTASIRRRQAILSGRS